MRICAGCRVPSPQCSPYRSKMTRAVSCRPSPWGKVFLPLQRKTKRGQRPAPMMGITGSVRDVVLELLYQTLLTAKPGRIRRCPGCRKIFVRTGRQTHCSSACYDRDYWANLPTKTVERYRKRQYRTYGMDTRLSLATACNGCQNRRGEDTTSPRRVGTKKPANHQVVRCGHKWFRLHTRGVGGSIPPAPTNLRSLLPTRA